MRDPLIIHKQEAMIMHEIKTKRSLPSYSQWENLFSLAIYDMIFMSFVNIKVYIQVSETRENIKKKIKNLRILKEITPLLLSQAQRAPLLPLVRLQVMLSYLNKATRGTGGCAQLIAVYLCCWASMGSSAFNNV